MPPSPQPRFAWNPWPAGIIAFFVMAVAGAISFVVFCRAHSTDLVAPDYYEQEVRYQTQMERLERARQLPQTRIVHYDSESGLVLITLPTAGVSSRPAGEIHLYRPADADLDRKLKLDLDELGRQSIDVRDLSPGLWKVKVLWSSGEKEYLAEEKVIIGARLAETGR